MTTTTSATGSVSSLGIGSGLDVNSIISSLMAVESQPLTLLQNKASTINTEISAVGQIQSLASALGDKAQALSSMTLWSQTATTSTDTATVTGDTSSGTAVPGSYDVVVSQLAKSQTVTSTAAAGTTLDSGTLTIQLGTWDSTTTPPGFTNKAGASPTTVTIAPGATSLSAVRDAINAANAGVSASIITDATGSRLSLRSTDTGAVNGFKITATEDVDDGNPATGLTALAYDPSTGNAQLQLNQASTDAMATVNGIPVESTTNTLQNVSDGLNLTLMRVNASPVTVTVAYDTASMQKAVTDFVSAYTALNANIHNATKYDGSTPPAAGTARKDGPLEGDPSIIGFQNQLRAIVNTTSTMSSVFQRLSDIGVSVQSDGSLAADSTKLQNALANPAELKKFFTTVGTTDTDTGVAVRFSNLIDGALGPNGSLASRESGLQGELSRNQQQQTDMQTHLDQTQARLTAQYQALDTTMSKMSALSTYVTQQVALMQKA
ncbi:MAG TPA: flagellar filament capping protein FliD [Burkholderiaceae bacterium]